MLVGRNPYLVTTSLFHTTRLLESPEYVRKFLNWVLYLALGSGFLSQLNSDAKIPSLWSSNFLLRLLKHANQRCRDMSISSNFGKMQLFFSSECRGIPMINKSLTLRLLNLFRFYFRNKNIILLESTCCVGTCQLLRGSERG